MDSEKKSKRRKKQAIDGAIGEGSQFHETYGYYAQGVGPDTAILPKDWMTRVHRVQNNNTNGRVGYCLDVLDLFLAKAAAGRDKDREFCMAPLEYNYLTPAKALEMVQTMLLASLKFMKVRAKCRGWLLLEH